MSRSSRWGGVADAQAKLLERWANGRLLRDLFTDALCHAGAHQTGAMGSVDAKDPVVDPDLADIEGNACDDVDAQESDDALPHESAPQPRTQAPWLRVPLGAPGREEIADRFAEAVSWAEKVRRDASQAGWHVHSKALRVGMLGMQTIPRSISLPTPQAALAALGAEQRTAAETFAQLLWAADQMPAAVASAARAAALERPHDVLAAAQDWQRILDVAAWLAKHPCPGIPLRAMPVAGVDTKLVERHSALLTRVLRRCLPPDALFEAPDFIGRFGFARPPRFVMLRAGEGSLGQPAGAEDVISWPLSTLARWDPRAAGITELVVVENLQSFHALPAAPGRLILWGEGHGAASMMAALAWAGSVPVRYWGDIDTHGLMALANCRRVCSTLRSELMTKEVLLAHRAFWASEREQASSLPPPELTVDEAALYRSLVMGAWGEGVRLEQELLDFTLVSSTFAA